VACSAQKAVAVEGIAVLDHGSAMDPMWKISAILSMLWAVVAVNRRNAGIKANS
jgi:hypothetical protein